MKKLDENENVVHWKSEVIIPYRSPIDGKIHRYFCDFFIETKVEGATTTSKSLVEVKPKAQTKPPIPVKNKRGNRRYIKEATTYAINQAKWSAAERYCVERGWRFVKLTETELGIKER